ncbi:uncharacterized protein LOC110624374 [Manihot esculenta]|uniref:Uncharacterized protein n=1 Tax=Manihot esculenta TaxID=3983 RepID=A0A2C9V4Z7_MANES|nr:uncharacterized protein LOC110624374 [Manihot esculenta]OAY39032.1 hypothetical protein MANES_10G061900v8 [Manihot esculenta]
MGSEKMMLLFLMFFNYFHFIAFSSSSSPLHKSFVSDSLQKDITGRHEDENNGIERDGYSNGRSGIINSSKFARGGAAGGRSTGAHGGAAENGNENGNSQAGAAVVPVIVAGAANNNRPKNSHRGAANSDRNCIRFPAMIMITLATLTVHIYM